MNDEHETTSVVFWCSLAVGGAVTIYGLHGLLNALGVVVAIAWAPLHSYGHANAAGNSSVEPLNYATAVPTVLVAVWALAAGWFAVTAFRRRSQIRGAEQPAPRPDHGA
jgi:hypothetical protein